MTAVLDERRGDAPPGVVAQDLRLVLAEADVGEVDAAVGSDRGPLGQAALDVVVAGGGGFPRRPLGNDVVLLRRGGVGGRGGQQRKPPPVHDAFSWRAERRKPRGIPHPGGFRRSARQSSYLFGAGAVQL